ncbi:MAG: hypothetical protein P8Z36_02780 [Gemmatimonadota bacterium]|jgi:peptide chain release factor subunit 1
MIARQDVERLLRRHAGDHPVLSVFLDMRVNSENKRTHGVFLNKQRGRYETAATERGDSRNRVGEAFSRIEAWLADDFDESNKGVACFAEVGGDWFDAIQIPVPLAFRAALTVLPVVGPLVEVMASYRHHGVVLVDRQHLRLMSMYLNEPVHEIQHEGEPSPKPHDVQRGAYSYRDYHDRRAVQETKQFFREFAGEVTRFSERFRPHDLILLGTESNVKKFREQLPAKLAEKVVYEDRAPVDADQAEIVERVRPFITAQADAREAEAVRELRNRIQQDHYAVCGFRDTLAKLQEHKVDRLVLARDMERSGACCCQCGFFFDEAHPTCPYCGGETRLEADLVEAMIRLAEETGAGIEFVNADTLREQHGVGALLRF